ncbi:CPBP family glutamic-type intramembrane protease [Stratiformator vulcanicus]|uniref:CAAX amino terminal protease self-immunity n=1 Tax=Stratiformator vulcanicus TaxID=2527980 RepID=A0A517R4D9_9PLAN|nr:CPBP family glutamic-type intramembrane protease [Stratiformator vulcanicus]QDT38749.1 CAAX amino terminal protease self- immunity [Stratiformator vulcanicus]
MKPLKLVHSRFIRAFRSGLTLGDLLQLAGCLGGFSLIAVPLGLATGLLRLAPPADAISTLLLYIPASFVLPSLIEETIFRVLFIPHPSERVSERRLRLACAVSLILFVLWHPMNAALFAPWTKPLFFRLDFLVIAAILGVGATYLYRRTGSVWAPVLFHWIIVLAWKLGLGGSVITFGPPTA